MSDDYGLYKNFGDPIEYYPVKASTTIERGDFVDLDASGYLQPCDAGDVPLGVAYDLISDAPSGDGDVDCGVFVGGQNIYVFPPDTGSATIASNGKLMDVGGDRSVNIDASTDGCLRQVGITDDGDVLVRLVPSAAAGV